jgi:hypothetical protein
MRMATGKQLGEFAFKFTSLTVSRGPANSRLIQANCEGPATGFGTVLISANFIGSKVGTCNWSGIVYQDDGGEQWTEGSGTYESSGKHHWHTHGSATVSDSPDVIVEGEIDLTARSWTGKVFEKI